MFSKVEIHTGLDEIVKFIKYKKNLATSLSHDNEQDVPNNRWAYYLTACARNEVARF